MSARQHCSRVRDLDPDIQSSTNKLPRIERSAVIPLATKICFFWMKKATIYMESMPFVLSRRIGDRIARCSASYFSRREPSSKELWGKVRKVMGRESRTDVAGTTNFTAGHA